MMNKEIFHTHNHEHTVVGEIVCHFPYAVVSVAFSLIILSFVSSVNLGIGEDVSRSAAHMLFHSFHFMHIVFAASGSILTFFRFSRNVTQGIIVGALSTITFCTLSDSVLPYFGGRLLGVTMNWHLCFAGELKNVLPFLFIGLLNGFVLSRHHSSAQTRYSLTSHFTHIFISSLASSFYLIANGFTQWDKQIGLVFLFLIVAIVVPCTLSDVVVPMFFACTTKKEGNARH